MKYFALNGDHRPEGWPDAGVVHAGKFAGAKDDNQWNMWLGWFHLMTADKI